MFLGSLFAPVLLMILLFWALVSCSFFSFFLAVEAVVITSLLDVNVCNIKKYVQTDLIEMWLWKKQGLLSVVHVISSCDVGQYHIFMPRDKGNYTMPTDRAITHRTGLYCDWPQQWLQACGSPWGPPGSPWPTRTECTSSRCPGWPPPAPPASTGSAALCLQSCY